MSKILMALATALVIAGCGKKVDSSPPPSPEVIERRAKMFLDCVAALPDATDSNVSHAVSACENATRRMTE